MNVIYNDNHDDPNTGRIVESVQCEYKLNDGRLCLEPTKQTTLCKKHLKMYNHLEIKKSTIPNAGLGLFATSNLKADTFICEYKGEIQYEIMSGPYVLELGKGKYLNGNSSINVGSYSNECHRNDKINCYCQGNNARLILNIDDRVYLRLTRNVKAGEEIFTSYGNSYWHQDELNQYFLSSS